MKENRFFNLAVGIIAFYFFVQGLYYLEKFLVPVLYAALLSMLFLPLCNFLEKKKFPRGVAMLICLLVIIICVSSILLLFYFQVATLSDDLPLFEQKALEKFNALESFIESLTHVSAERQTEWVKNNYSKAFTMGTDVVKGLLVGLSGGLEVFLIVIIYIIFFLSMRERFLVFLLKLFPKEKHEQVLLVIEKTENVTRHYMSGQIQVLLIIGVLNWIGFMALGIKQAFFWGMLRGLLNIIPYVGAVIGTVFPLLTAMAYKEGIIYPLGVIGIVIITQLIQDNFLIPKIIGSHIKINALATIMAIIAGGMLWGVNGMVLFLPLLGIFKIICDHVDVLKPLGYLLGEDGKDELK